MTIIHGEVKTLWWQPASTRAGGVISAGEQFPYRAMIPPEKKL